MRADMGEQIRERPAFEDTIKEQQQQDMKSETKKELSLEADKTSAITPQWNIPSEGEDEGLEVLMSNMALTHKPDHVTSPRVQALCRLVRLALSRADRGELKELAETAAQKSRPDFVRHLRKLLDKGSMQPKDGKLDAEASKRTGDERTTPEAEPGRAQIRDERRHVKPKRNDLMVELKDENDLCPRSPSRPLHQRPNNSPYQNTSRNHHSGGSVAYSDAIAPSFTEDDLEILMSIAVDDRWFNTSTNTPIYDTNVILPESVWEINSQFDAGVNFSKEADHQVPTNSETGSNILEELSPYSTTFDPWAAGNYEDSTSGCSSMSPNGVLSPDSGRVVPDDVAPNMSPSGQFFDDRLPLTSDYGLNFDVYAKTGESYRGDRSPGSSGYSTGTPSPTEYPSSNELVPQDFDTKVQITSYDDFCNLDDDLDSSHLLPEFENVFESTEPNFPQQSYAPTDATTPSDRVSYYPSNLATNANHSTALGSPDVPCSIPDFDDISDLANNANHTTYPTVNNASVAFAPSYTVGGHTYLDAIPITVNAANLQLAMPVFQAKVVPVSASVSTLKRLEPKVEHVRHAETGRERILKLLVDKKKKAEAWVKISLHPINEVVQPDADGDTQLMILCTNTKGSVESHALEYVYTMVEMLKGIPRAISAVNNQGQSALYMAALHGEYAHRAIVVRYIAETLVEIGEDVGCTTDSGESMLHELCQQGDQRYDVLVELLSLKNRAGQPYFNVNQYNAMGLTPLHVAVKSYGANNLTSLKTVQLLMAEGADISLTEKSHSNTALHLAVLKSCAPCLVRALLRGPSQAVERACKMFNATGDSCLHCAASRNELPVAQQMKVIQLLLEHGAVKSHNANGKFPIALVAEERRLEIRRVYESRKGNQVNVGMI